MEDCAGLENFRAIKCYRVCAQPVTEARAMYTYAGWRGTRKPKHLLEPVPVREIAPTIA